MEKSKNFSLNVAPRVPMSFLKQIQPIRFSRLVSHSKHRNERGALLYRLKLNSYFFLQSFSFLKMSFTISNKNTKITYNKMQIFQKHVFFCQFCLRRVKVVFARYNWTVFVPLKYLILMPNIQEAKCFEFTVQIQPPLPPIEALGGWQKKCRAYFGPPPRFISVFALGDFSKFTF